MSNPGPPGGAKGPESAWLGSLRRLLPLAWPVFVGQLAVLAFSTVDTILLGRHSAADLAALAVGASAYICTFVGLMGVVMAVSPVVGQLFGAGRLTSAGEQLHQAVWLALGLSTLGCSVLLWPVPFLWLAQATPEVADRVGGYLTALAVSLPAALLFQVYRAFNTAVSRPKAVMALQLGGLALKVPLSVALVSGVPALGLPAMGVTGCGIATACAMWTQLLLAAWQLRRDPYYQRFELWQRGLQAPRWQALAGLLRLGVPIGLAILVEVTGFAAMALFISRLGTLPVAGHQIAANLVSLMFMVPLALANAGSTLVAQRVGAGDRADAQRLGWHTLQFSLLLATLLGVAVHLGRDLIVAVYTADAAVAAAALPLLTWVVVFHVADAGQTVGAFVLRAWRITTVPMLIYVGALGLLGLGGGYVVAFNLSGATPPELQGSRGFWAASTTGLVLAALAMVAFMHRVLSGRRGPGLRSG